MRRVIGWVVCVLLLAGCSGNAPATTPAAPTDAGAAAVTQEPVLRGPTAAAAGTGTEAATEAPAAATAEETAAAAGGATAETAGGATAEATAAGAAGATGGATTQAATAAPAAGGNRRGGP